MKEFPSWSEQINIRRLIRFSNSSKQGGGVLEVQHTAVTSLMGDIRGHAKKGSHRATVVVRPQSPARPTEPLMASGTALRAVVGGGSRPGEYYNTERCLTFLRSNPSAPSHHTHQRPQSALSAARSSQSISCALEAFSPKHSPSCLHLNNSQSPPPERQPARPSVSLN